NDRACMLRVHPIRMPTPRLAGHDREVIDIARTLARVHPARRPREVAHAKKSLARATPPEGEGARPDGPHADDQVEASRHAATRYELVGMPTIRLEGQAGDALTGRSECRQSGLPLRPPRGRKGGSRGGQFFLPWPGPRISAIFALASNVW